MGPGQLALPTPCSTWPVHDLINHIVGATRYFADLAEWGSLCDEVRKDGTAPFAAAIEVPGDAPAADQLAGFLGRAPSWFGAQ